MIAIRASVYNYLSREIPSFFYRGEMKISHTPRWKRLRRAILREKPLCKPRRSIVRQVYNSLSFGILTL